MSADLDASRAFLLKWSENEATLAPLVPGGLHADTLPPQPASPYAQLLVDQHKEPEYSSPSADGTQPYIDYRKVTVKLFGVGKATVDGVVTVIKGFYDNQPLAVQDASHMRTQPLKNSVQPTGQFKDANEVYNATMEWVLWTHRTK